MAFPISPGVSVSEIDLTTIVPAVSTTTGVIVGVFPWGPINTSILVTSENELISNFTQPTNLNPKTFFTASSFLNYGSSLYVTRIANTTTAVTSNLAVSACANVGTLANVASVSVLNSDDYLLNHTTFDANTYYVAKYPGAIGNSLKISICDSVNAYSSNLNLIGVVSTNNITGNFTINIGSNIGSFYFTSDGTVSNANTYANTVASGITAGDLINVGNSTIGQQMIRVANVGVVSSNSSGAVFTLGFATPYRLAVNYVANTSVNGNSSIINLNRNWQYYNSFTGAPVQSHWVQQYGNTAAMDSMHIVITDAKGGFTGVADAILETYPNLSRATDSSSDDGASIYYKNALNKNSKYIWWANDRAGALSANSLLVSTSGNQTPLSLQMQNGADGADENSVSLGLLASGYSRYNSKDTSSISLVLQGAPVGGTTIVNGYTVNNFQLANWLVQNIAEIRKDCLVFISPDDAIVTSNPGNEAPALAAWYGALGDSTYQVVDSGFKYMYDRFNDVYRYIPLNGDIAGLCARTDATNNAWWSPAGFNRGQIANIVKLRYNPNKASRDLLYNTSINPVVTFPGQGTYLFGDKTGTAKPSAFDRINVRRLFIVLEKAITLSANYSLFEFNDAFTRAQFTNSITTYLRGIQGLRGITSFKVICDATNNTPDVIAANRFAGDIYIQPNRSINFIQLNFVAVRTGVDFNTIIGQF